MANFIRLSLVLLFRMSFWCLVTSSIRPSNLLLGLVICLFIPFGDFRKLRLNVLLPELLLTLLLPFDMLKESFQLMLIPDPKDEFVDKPVSVSTKQGSNYGEFMDLFRITFTPMSLVARRKNIDFWKVHVVKSAFADEQLEDQS